MIQNLNCSCCFITGNIKVTCAKVFWLQITYRDCTISQTSKGFLQFHSQTENIWTFFSYTSKYSLWQVLRCSAQHECQRLDGTFWNTVTYSDTQKRMRTKRNDTQMSWMPYGGWFTDFWASQVAWWKHLLNTSLGPTMGTQEVYSSF